MLARILSAVATAFRAALGVFAFVVLLPFRLLSGGGQQVAAPPAALEPTLIAETASADQATARQLDCAGLKRFAADLLIGRQPHFGRYRVSAKTAEFMRCLDRGDAMIIAAAPTQLEAHLTGRKLMHGLPPVGRAAEVMEWKRIRRATLQRTAAPQDLPAAAQDIDAEPFALTP